MALLRYLAEFAESENLHDDLAFEVQPVRWIVCLDANGNLTGQGPMETEGERPRRGKEYPCPKTKRSKNIGGVAEFMADGLTAVFGLDAKQRSVANEDTRENNRKKFEDFWRQIEDAYEKTQYAPLKAVLDFKPDPDQPLDFLRWDHETSAWLVVKADGEEAKLGNGDRFSFEVEGRLLLYEDPVQRYWREQFEQERRDQTEGTERGLCIVTGERGAQIAQTHGVKVKRVPGASPMGASIVSFDKPAFTSYGFKKSLNAPTSIRAAEGYASALNRMLGLENHSIRLSQAAVCCFWTRDGTDTGPIAGILNEEDPIEVRKFLRSPWAGLSREARADRFYAATFAGNSGRVVVRHWTDAALESVIENLRRWFQDLELEPLFRPSEKMPALALSELAGATVRDKKDLKADVVSQLFRAALEDARPSVALLHPILSRLSIDTASGSLSKPKILNHSRFALMKLVLNRNRKENAMEIQEKATLDAEDAAYQCGRLLAILEEAQQKAHEYNLKGAGVVERYFGSAMASPASVFPILLKLNRHHLNKIRTSERYGTHARFIDEDIQDAIAGIDQFPPVLNLHAQGRFAIGFYQQKAADRAAREERRDNPQGTLNMGESE